MCDTGPRDVRSDAPERVTSARLVDQLITMLGEPIPAVAQHLGVSRETVHRWRKRFNDEVDGVESPGGRAPTRGHILHLRALIAIKRGVPSMYRTLRWGQSGFEQALADVRPQRLMSEPDQSMVRDVDFG